FRGDGAGAFTPAGSFAVGPSVSSLAVADFNRDGFPDIVSVSGSTATGDNISVLLNSLGTGFNNEVPTTLLRGTALRSVAVTDVNHDAFPDLAVTVGAGGAAVDNAFTLLGVGDGSFTTPTPYQTTGAGTSTGPSFVAVVSDPFLRATTFTTGGNTV